MTKVLHSSKRKHIVAALSVIAVLSAIPTVFGTSGFHKSPASVQEQSNASQPVRHEVLGDSVVAKQYSVHVTGTTISPTEATSQTKRVTVAVSIQNLSNTTMQVSPGLQMTLTDTSGRVYSMTADYLDPNTTIGGPIAPSDTANLQIDFKLPSNVTPFSFNFQQDANSPTTKVGL